MIVHELTAIGSLDLRHFDRDFTLTNRLRTDGTDHLLSAGTGGRRPTLRRPRGRRLRRVRTHRRPREERGRPTRPHARRRHPRRFAAIRHVEEATLGATWTEGIVLRYGVLYGPGTSLAPGEEQFELIRKRKFPLVGDAGSIWSFIHVADHGRGNRRSGRAPGRPRRLQRGRRRSRPRRRMVAGRSPRSSAPSSQSASRGSSASFSPVSLVS